MSNKINRKVNRVMLVGSGSGCGKTTVTMALTKAIKIMSKDIMVFKCGPDYIDPMFYSYIIETKARNLDLYLLEENTLKYLLGENSKTHEYSIIEGAMGMYDGKGFTTDEFSANHISLVTGTPEILVVNCKGKSVSLLAEISGYMNYSKNNLKGVILNNCTENMYSYYKEMIENNLNIKVYGYMPHVKEASLESRHLGLVTAAEIPDLDDKLNALGNIATESLDVKGILALSEDSEDLEYDDIVFETPAKKVRVALARDNAFSFYYEDNLKLLETLGAELVEFSPIKDDKLPENISGLILGGGYPEVYAEEISKNISMKNAVKEAIQQGIPTFAECGGFMYLGDSITTEDVKYPMVGLTGRNSKMTDKLVRFGYKEIFANEDNIFCKKGESIRCHEFHHSEMDDYGNGFTAVKGKLKQDCVVAGETIYAGYPHLHLWANLQFAQNFMKKCMEFKGA